MKKRIVIKVGTHVLYDDTKLSCQRLENLISFIAQAKEKYEVILVSSAAIATGYTKIKLDKSIIENRQALAAVGQPELMNIYSQYLEKYKLFAGQILLTAEDFDSNKRTTHSKAVVETLLQNNILPIINENDATAIKEIVFGDNDQLSAHIAYHFNADLLIILSDIDGYYNKDPRENSDAKVKKEVHEISPEELTYKSTTGTLFATGGITTKLKAADFLLKKHLSTFLTSGFDLKDAKSFLLEEKQLGGTLFTPTKSF